MTRIFAAGLATESNTFSPVPTGMEDFIAMEDLLETWRRLSVERGYEYISGATAWAPPRRHDNKKCL